MSFQRLTQLLKFLQESPDDPFLLFALAKEYEKLDEINVSLEYYNRLLEEHPDYVGSYYHLGKLFLKLGNVDSALDTYKKGMAIATKEGNIHALSELRGAYLEIDDIEE